MQINRVLMIGVLGTMFSSLDARASSHCDRVFTSRTSVVGKNLGFTQAFIGRRWGDYKTELLREEFNQSQMQNPQLTRAQFIQQKVAAKPIPAIRDMDGKVRIIDKHHGLYSMSRFYGREIDFGIDVLIVKDYSLRRVTSRGNFFWTPEKMLRDMVQNGFLNITGEITPTTIRWLESIPNNILKIGDLPLRSLVSFIFESFEVPVRGSDFRVHVQNQLGSLLTRQQIVDSGKIDFSEASIRKIKDEMLRAPEVLEFFLENLLPGKAHSSTLEAFFNEYQGETTR